MRRENFDPQVGDLVAIRDWDDMEEEFGLNEYESIKCEFNFTEAMRSLCGREFTITKIEYGKYFGLGTGFSISKDMLRMADEEYTDFDDSEISKYLSTVRVI